MKLNITMPNSMHVEAMNQPWEYELDGRQIGEILQLVDELGYHKVMLGEHFILPQDHVPLSGDHYFHSQVALAFAAGHTRNIRLSSSVNILPLQNPVVQAKAWASLDWLSGGRAEPMFGVGWLKEEYDILNVPFNKRGRLCDEYLEAMVELWTRDVPSFEGEYVSFRDAAFAPKPIQKPFPPLWFGGDADPVLKRVARYGSGWSPFQTPPEQFPERLDFIRSQPGFDGRQLNVFFALIMLNVGPEHQVKDDPRAPGSWDAGKTIEQCQWLAELGVTETIVPMPPLEGVEAFRDWLRWCADDIMPHI